MKPGCRNNNLTRNQLGGAVLVALSALFIPAVLFFYREYVYSAPVILLGDQRKDFVTIEIDGNTRRGIYFLPEGTRLEDLLSLLRLRLNSIKSTPADSAPPDFFNPLKDGVKIMVLRDEKKKFEIRLGTMSASTRIALNMPIDVNSASMAELELVPGIGEKTAQKIIEARNQKGKFHKLEEMMKINGIKQKKLDKLRPFLCVEPF